MPLRHVLTEMGHPQPPTIIHTDNTTTTGFANDNIQLKRSKSWDMNLHWLRDKETKKDINVTWGPGKNNTADYFTKVSHTMLHHKQTRPKYIID